MNRRLLAFVTGCSACVAPEPSASTRLVEVRAGTEETTCSTLELTSDAPIDVHSIHVALGRANHVAIYRATREGAACGPMAGGAPLFVATHGKETLVLPEGVVYSFTAHERLFVETDGAAVETLDLVPSDPGEIVTEAEITYVSLASPVELPANAASVRDGFVVPLGERDTRYFAFVGHTRRYGVGVSVAISTGVLFDKVPLYFPVGFHPEAPPMFTTTPRPLPADGSFYLQCSYFNVSAARATDETCGFWAYHAAGAAGAWAQVPMDRDLPTPYGPRA